MSHSPPMPDSGMIDLHSHLLAGVDDGCQTLSESVDCIRKLMAAGFRGSVCTPHVGPGYYDETTADLLLEKMNQLRQAIADAGLEYVIWEGGEIRIREETIEWFSFWGLPTLGHSRCLLLDYWGYDWPEFATETCQYLLENGYQPIVAHPERLRADDEAFGAMMAVLSETRVWLQGNLNSFSGGEGEIARERAWRLLEQGAYFTLASDTHHPEGMQGRIQAINQIAKKFGRETIDRLLIERPREILAHK